MATNNNLKNFAEIQTFLRESGFIFQGSEIYGGLANTYDYGPLGVILTRNVKDAWWKKFITQASNVYGLDSKVLLNPKVWEASGHVNNFIDPLIENRTNNKRYRADDIIKEFAPLTNVEKMDLAQMEAFLKAEVKEWEGEKASWASIKAFNLLFETEQGVVTNKKTKLYLRPENAQGIYINFLNVQRTMRTSLPFGIGQIGKAFRNEVTPGNYIFRTREFDQMELEYFTAPETAASAFASYVNQAHDFVLNLGLRAQSLRLREQSKDELAHYAVATTDIEFLFPFGWGELLGVANRGDYDLKAHSQASGQKLVYFDQASQKAIMPHVIEPSIGVDRLTLALLVDAYDVEALPEGESRTVLRLHKKLAPYQFAVLPLSPKAHGAVAKWVYEQLKLQNFSVIYDEEGSIGKRYRRQDAIGTPFAITVIDSTESENKVTVRFRDSMKQIETTLDLLHELLN